MEFKSVETQTEKNTLKLIKIESFGTIKLDRYYFDTETESIITIRNGKNGKIKKQIQPTKTLKDKLVVILKDVNNKPRTINYTTLIEFCHELAKI